MEMHGQFDEFLHTAQTLKMEGTSIVLCRIIRPFGFA